MQRASNYECTLALSSTSSVVLSQGKDFVRMGRKSIVPTIPDQVKCSDSEPIRAKNDVLCLSPNVFG